MSDALPRDIFDTARRMSAIGLVVAALVATAGAFSDWVTIEPPPILPPDQASKAEPFTGVEAGDGWWIVAAAAVYVVAAIGLWTRGGRKYAWMAFAAAVAGGGIVVADYRGIGDISSSLSQRVDIVGSARPAIGITLAAAGMIGGLVAAVTGLIATPAGRGDG